MASSELVELKPCPFCGGEARMGEVVGEMPNFYPIVKCKACFNRGLPGNTEAEAIAKWNTRPDQPLLSATHYAEVDRAEAIRFCENALRNVETLRLCEDDLEDIRGALEHFVRKRGDHGTPHTSETE